MKEAERMPFSNRTKAYREAVKAIELAIAKAEQGQGDCDTVRGGCRWCLKEFRDQLRREADKLDLALSKEV